MAHQKQQKNKKPSCCQDSRPYCLIQHDTT